MISGDLVGTLDTTVHSHNVFSSLGFVGFAKAYGVQLHGDFLVTSWHRFHFKKSLASILRHSHLIPATTALIAMCRTLTAFHCHVLFSIVSRHLAVTCFWRNLALGVLSCLNVLFVLNCLCMLFIAAFLKTVIIAKKINHVHSVGCNMG